MKMDLVLELMDVPGQLVSVLDPISGLGANLVTVIHKRDYKGGRQPMKIVIIDGQGGRMGKAVIEQLKSSYPELELYAIGTNSIATSAMLKAGASYGATGENPVIVNARNADLIIGPIGIVMADSLMGEITAAMATAVSSSSAYKILIPVNRCNHFIAGCQGGSLSDYIRQVCEEVGRHLSI